MKKTVIALLASVAVAGAAVAEPQQNVPNTDTVSPAPSQFANKGTVLEVIESPMYTYLQVSSDAGPVWLAAYRNGITKGDTVSYPDGVVMRNFYSKSLNRTFEKIIFVDAVAAEKK